VVQTHEKRAIQAAKKTIFASFGGYFAPFEVLSGGVFLEGHPFKPLI
jgi:hypothetical protein